MDIKLTNTKIRKKELFKPQKPQTVSMYVCGITPYDVAHIGHGRGAVTFDVLVRLFTFFGYNVTHVRNVTDIDDKLLARAEKQGNIQLYKEIADHFTQRFNDVLTKLGCRTPTHEPRATECIPDIIDFIQKLVDTGHAYVVDGDVYFDITSFKNYGKLSGREQEDLLAGARVEVDQRKRNAGDFALWKSDKEARFWDSPWGNGRPGWHIECSVMVHKYLGKTVDIHGGGMDLIFPHHENEIAQSESLFGQELANVWMHNGFVNINKEKMSKSLGNFISLESLFEKEEPMVVRFFYLQYHYRNPFDFSYEDLAAARTAYKRLALQLNLGRAGEGTAPIISSADALQACENDPKLKAMLEALCDDLNTPQFFGLVFEHLADCKKDEVFAGVVKYLLQTICGLTMVPLAEQQQAVTPEIEKLLQEREDARKQKDWARADRIRDQLKDLGYSVQDKKA